MSELATLARSVFAIGFEGRTCEDVGFDRLRAFAPGGLVLFERNVGAPEELRELVAALRALGDPPPLVAVDQEGGRVARLGPPPVGPLPSAMALGATGDAELCERLGTQLGAELAALGISVDFAPVADLALDPANTVIGTRAFGDDPARVAAFVGAFARGLECGGVAATLKHFPGHGATAVDSHRALPRLAVPAATLRERELVPFARAIAAREASLVMVGHLVVEAFDDERPATLSRRVVDGLLREELGFAGVVCTDCLEMDAIARGVGTAAGAVAALEAGADLLLVSQTFEVAEAAAAAVAATAAAHPRTAARLVEAAQRVAALRARCATTTRRRPAVEPPRSAAAACRALTVLRGELRLAAGRPVSVVSFEGPPTAAADGRAGRPSLSAALRARRWKSELMRVALDPAPDDVTLLLDELAVLGERNFVVVVRRAHLHPLQRAAVTRLAARIPSAIVVSAGEPFDALLWPQARTVACTYGDDELMLEACADVLAGRAVAGGGLPLACDAPR